MSPSQIQLHVPPIGRGLSMEQAVERAASAPRADFVGTGTGGLAPLLARLAQRRKRPIVVIVEDPKRAAALESDLSYHLSALSGWDRRREILAFPAHELSPYDEMTADRRPAMERMSSLSRMLFGEPWSFLVLPAQALPRRLPPRELIESHISSISIGERVDRDQLLRSLVSMGYHSSPLVEERGTFGVRGSIVDVFPPYLELPVRIDFFGDEVEAMRVFDPESQRSGVSIAECWLHPATCWLPPAEDADRTAVSARLRDICDAVDQPTNKTERLIDDVFGGHVVVGKDGLLPALFDEMGSLLDYCPDDALFALENPAAARLVWHKQESSLARDFQLRQEGGFPGFSPECHLIDAPALEERLLGRDLILVHPLEIVTTTGHPLEVPVDGITLGGIDTNNLGERLGMGERLTDTGELIGRFAGFLEQLIAEGYRAAVVAHTDGHVDRLRSMLKSHGLEVADDSSTPGPGVTVERGELIRGSLQPADGWAWISEEEVFGRRARRRAAPARSRFSMDDLRRLEEGDLVVHSEHGIGRYEGLVRQKVRNAEVEFLLITYKDADKLYLPVYRLSQIQKYNGGDARRSLDKLGGQTFSRALRKAKKAAVEMASKLLDLYARRAAASRPALPERDEYYSGFEAAFPFEETDDQMRAIDEVMADLERTKPMDRLVCGDVGFGKTEVALRAAFRMVMTGRQVAVLVPTTVLAQQHYQSFLTRFADYPLQIALLSRFRTTAQNKATVQGLKDGTVDVVVGTHRLLSKDVHFGRLGLLVVDEEHRFGVTHKERIRSLRASVDTLVLTATPIPRTLQMSMSGIRDLSIIASAPAERRPIITRLCHDDSVVIKEAIERELAREGQVFFVHNRVHDIEKVAQRVRKLAPDARVAIGHGQMKEQELERVMLDFVAGRSEILVCTTIVESGLDIPRANTIIIDRADTFGLAQLYQLRGRVGRADRQAHALLIVPPLSMLSDEARERVETLARYSDLGSGFSVATMDMEIRGAGNLLGAEQSGNASIVGYEMFCELLAESTAELQGIPYERDIEPELTFERPGLLPESYINDVATRLHYYKRLAMARSEQEVENTAAEMIDRFGTFGEEAEDLIRTMVAKSYCRALRIPGMEVTERGMTLHLAPDVAVDPERVVDLVHEEAGRVVLTGDLRLVVRFKPGDDAGSVGAIHFLRRLGSYDKRLDN